MPTRLTCWVCSGYYYEDEDSRSDEPPFTVADKEKQEAEDAQENEFGIPDSYMDDISSWNINEVCKHWRNILEVNTSQAMWRRYLKQRFPLYQNFVEVPNWFQVFNRRTVLK